ncbi:MAG: V-type ATP synthase subunit D, partial [Thaumarchaeota archaeon]|nr:V-type ATP synthase subunit D [Nitrososphaerota archaeon]
MPSAINIRPTRLEYIRTKRRILIAKKGLKLLKLKRQALILEFFNTTKTATALRSSLQSELLKGYESVRMAEMLAGSMRLENEAMKIPQLSKLQVRSKNVMGVRIPKLEGGHG